MEPVSTESTTAPFPIEKGRAAFPALEREIAGTLVGRAWGEANVGAGDRILLTEMEHHSNIVPWQQLAERVGAEIDWAPIDDEGRLDMDAFAALLERGPKLVAITHVSNVLGTENPLAEIARQAHAAGALVLADGAQSAPKLPLDVAALGVDVERQLR